MKNFIYSIGKMAALLTLFTLVLPSAYAEAAEEDDSKETLHLLTVQDSLEVQHEETLFGTLEEDTSIVVSELAEEEYLLQWGQEEIILDSAVIDEHLLEPLETEEAEEEQESTQKTTLSAETVLYQDNQWERRAGEVLEDVTVSVISETDEYIEIELAQQSFYVQTSDDSTEEAVEEDTTEESNEQESNPVENDTEQQKEEEADQGEEQATESEESDASEESESAESEQATTEEEQASEEDTASEEESTEEEPSTEENTEETSTEENDTDETMEIAEADAQFSDSDQYFEVTVSNLTVYDNSSGSLESVGKLKKGQVFKRIKSVGNWHKIQFAEKTGYVWKEATKPASEESVQNWTSPSSHSHKARAWENLTVYDNSGDSLELFAQIYAGNEFQYVKQVGSWLIVEIGGRTGYVYEPAAIKPFTNDTKYFEVLVDYQSIYDNSSGSLEKTGVLREGEVYERVADYGNWHKIMVAGEPRYVLKSTTKPASKSAESNWYSASDYQSRELTALERLTIYDNSSGSLVPFGYIEEGESINYVRTVGNWAIIDYGGRKGYVYEPATSRTFKDSDQYFEVLKDGLTIYDKSSGSLKRAGTLPKGAVLERTRDLGNWHQLEFGDRNAYVWKADTKPSSAPPNRSDDPSYQRDKLTFSQTAIVQDNSSGSLKAFAKMDKGQVYPYIRRVGNWYEIDLGGRIGYIYHTAVEDKRQFTYSSYSHDYESMLDEQMKRTPKVDGAGKYLASKELVSYYAHPESFDRDSSAYLQFLILSQSANLNADEINEKVLKGKGTLEGTAEAFIEAGEKYNVNEAYLIAHALHETAHGKSTLAQGVEVNGKTVYNMYGIKAYDSCPTKCGSEHAYDEEWFTPEAAVIGGAKFIAEGWIERGQDTLYKMRWNPSSPGYPQYATHVSWAIIQTKNIAEIYNSLDSYTLKFDVPEYKNQPSPSAMPTAGDRYYVDISSAGTKAETTTDLNLREGPSTSFSKVRMMDKGEKLEILGENGDWYKLQAGSDTGWAHGDYIKFSQQLKVVGIHSDSVLRVRDEPSTDGDVIGELNNNEYVTGDLDEDDNFIKEDGWYKIIYDNQTGWVHGDFIEEQ
ncbi:SH3 domain-containing protein [Gracilibacillus sp. YIM 98692]|uniref:SH3 domain-containing protein n=1 Tax=Gracilibacillus sp. YIM 98692 TaxID=2663532 RepID=UPI0013D72B4E|nr:SH3 domain-containing protein [Gracilibacillus sp. YIM 98692]